MIDYFHTKAPGVYIEEIVPIGPIVGVSTSTVAFIGPAMSGPIGKPIRITNWTQFTQKFGRYPTAPKTLFYTPYAVSGFFNNSGTVAYMVRVGTGQQALLDLKDRATTEQEKATALVVTAKQEGTVGNSIQVSVQDAHIVNSAHVATARVVGIVSSTTNTITLNNANDAQQFCIGDIISIDTATTNAEHSQITLVQDNQITLASNLLKTHGLDSTLCIADLQKGQSSFRIINGQDIETGSVIQLSEGTTVETHVVASFSPANGFVTLADGLQNTFSLGAATTIAVKTLEFSLTFSTPTSDSEFFNNLSMDPRHSCYFAKVIASKPSTLVNVTLPEVSNRHLPPTNQPEAITGVNLDHGADDTPSSINLKQYMDALTALAALNDVSILCVPDASTSTDRLGIQQTVVDHCGNMRDRFAILDSAPGLSDISQVTTQRSKLQSKDGYAAIYYPWISVNDPASATSSGTLLIPPSGHIAGIYARSDSQRGVHKAPANEVIAGARELEFIKGTGDYDLLNQSNVNALRSFAGQPPVVWGARTIAEVPWQYINVRRLFIFIEQSLLSNLRWVVFEPNDTALWKKLERTISEFLSRIWRGGALFGNKASEAFYVKINEELNPPATRSMGQVFIEIGIAPVRPAEFVIVRIGMWDGGSQTSEG